MTASNTLPGSSRIWVYQAEREFTPDEANEVSRSTADFIESWTSHSQQVHASFELRYNRFLVLMLDESRVPAGGCSIDTSVHFIRSLESKFQNPMTDRMRFAFRDGDKIRVMGKGEFEELVTAGNISGNTVVFNNLVSSKRELDSQWEIPMKESWHHHYFKKVS